MPIFKRSKLSFEGGGLVLFMDVSDAMKAEKVLKKAEYTIKLVAPPPELRKGCDLAVEINLVEQPGIERLLNEKDTPYVQVTPLKVGTSEILEIVKVTDFGDWLMVKAANMKLSFEKEAGIIVNPSGGRCPDIPSLPSEMTGEKRGESPRPKDVGFTLCALMLGRALDEAISLWQGDK